MMACLDVAYSGLEAKAAAVLFHSWDDSAGERCFTYHASKWNAGI